MPSNSALLTDAYFAAAAIALLISGCAAIQPVVQRSALPEAGAAYVAGKFTRTNSGGFAFVLVNVESQMEYEISLGEDSTMPTDVTNQVTLVKVQPGRYAVKYWYTYGTLTKQRSGRSSITSPILAAPFDAKAGSIVFLGSYSAETTTTGMTMRWTVKPIPTNAARARLDVREAYPLFTDLEVNCYVCF